MMRLVAAPARAKHQFPSDISDYRNHTLYSIGRLASRGMEGFGMSMGPTILDAAGGVHLVAESLADAGAHPASPNTDDDYRRIVNGTTTMAGAIDKAVAAAAPSRVRVPRPANPPFVPIEDLP